MANEDTAVAFKITYTLIWIFLASYYFSWGANEPTVTAPVDESGWVADGALAQTIASRTEIGEGQTVE